MDVENILWKEVAVSKFKDLVRRNLNISRNKGLKFVEVLWKGVKRIQEHPYIGFKEPSLSNYPMQIRFYNLDNNITIIYYIESENLFVVDLWEEGGYSKGRK